MKLIKALTTLSILASCTSALAMGGVQIGSGNASIKCRTAMPAQMDMQYFDVEVIELDGKMAARLNGQIYNRDIQVEEYQIGPDTLKAVVYTDSHNNLNDGERRIHAFNFYMTDKETKDIFGDTLKTDFNLSEVKKVRLYDLDGNSKSNKFGGVVLVEAFDAQGNMLGRLFSSMFPGVCR